MARCPGQGQAVRVCRQKKWDVSVSTPSTPSPLHWSPSESVLRRKWYWKARPHSRARFGLSGDRAPRRAVCLAGGGELAAPTGSNPKVKLDQGPRHKDLSPGQGGALLSGLAALASVSQSKQPREEAASGGTPAARLCVTGQEARAAPRSGARKAQEAARRPACRLGRAPMFHSPVCVAIRQHNNGRKIPTFSQGGLLEMYLINRLGSVSTAILKPPSYHSMLFSKSRLFWAQGPLWSPVALPSLGQHHLLGAEPCCPQTHVGP